MCGRFDRYTVGEWIKDSLKLDHVDPLPPSYNIAPSQDALVILDESPNEAHALRWGLVPHWAKAASMQYSMINAKAETLNEKPAYRQLVKRRRCVVLADGFYEWKKDGGRKQPYHIQYARGLFVMAGLWDEWESPTGEKLRTFTIITTTPNPLVASIHDRMPVILRPEERGRWLEAANLDALKPFSAEEMRAYPVSAAVNSPRNNRPELIAEVG